MSTIKAEEAGPAVSRPRVVRCKRLSAMLLLGFFLAATVSFSWAATDCYGDIDKLKPLGKGHRDVAASQKAVKDHIKTLNNNKICYEQVAEKYCLPASVIGGLASRESNGGDSLKDGYGDKKRAWGILQCDLKTAKQPCKNCGAYSCCHIEMMVSKLLVPFIQQVKKKHPSWKPEQQLQGGVAAYNFGPDDVRTWERLDVGTTNGDYSHDIMARAQYLKKTYGWS